MLVFETPVRPGDVDLSIDIAGMSEDDADAYVREFHQRMSSRNINLKCGPEPVVNPEAVRLSAAALLAIRAGDQPEQKVIMEAERSGSFFYWRYAAALAYNELVATVGDTEANRLTFGDDRTRSCELRAAKMRWVMKERFGFDME